MANFKDDDVMPFGKYKGTKMANVPASYLEWARKSWTLTPTTSGVLGYIQDYREAIELELKNEANKTGALLNTNPKTT